ncbi:MAG: hypothetical protein COB12_10295 [Flavobacterium sp.]|nr:MAG: hypothetical protein COB12_10295 [Flavobacterium sp.]
MGKNKTGKYLKYAIGEIILVVIGILIALSINNWNENRKNSVLIKSYKNNLIENLSIDSLKINETISKIEDELNQIYKFEQRVSNSSNPYDTILKIARYDYKFNIEVHYDFIGDTYQVLNSTGDIGLFENVIIEDLNALYNLQERALFSSGQSFETYRNGLTLYAQKYPFSFGTNLIQNGTVAADKVWNDISISNHATQFNALIIAKGDSYRLALKQLPLILDKTNELLIKLRE